MTKGIKLDLETASGLQRLRDLEKKYKLLQEEHELLKKAIPVCFSNPVSIKSGEDSALERPLNSNVMPYGNHEH